MIPVREPKIDLNVHEPETLLKQPVLDCGNPNTLKSYAKKCLDTADAVADSGGEQQLVDALTRRAQLAAGIAQNILGEEAERHSTASTGVDAARRVAGDYLVDHATGREIPLLSRGDAWQAKSGNKHGRKPSLGRAIRAALTGDWSNAQIEASDMSTRSGVGGGFLVPDSMVADVIDAARAQSVCMAAGARIFAMPSEAVTMTRVSGDPVFTFKEQNAAFEQSSVTFEELRMEAKTIGCYVALSRELAMDAINGTTAVEVAMARALGAAIDRLWLQGSGAGQPWGLKTHSRVADIPVGGAVDYDDLLDAIETVESANAIPAAWIGHPQHKRDLAKLRTGDGTNSAAAYLQAPADVAALSRYVTTNCPTTDLFIGDFTNLVLGFRENIRIELSQEAGDAFKKHQVLIKAYARLDGTILRPDHIARLSGITEAS
jgi:HK97 family phage major capsid protein